MVLQGTNLLTDHHASRQHYQHLQQPQVLQPQISGWVVVDGVAVDVVDAAGRHGDPLGDWYLTEPSTLRTGL